MRTSSNACQHTLGGTRLSLNFQYSLISVNKYRCIPSFNFAFKALKIHVQNLPALLQLQVQAIHMHSLQSGMALIQTFYYM